MPVHRKLGGTSDTGGVVTFGEPPIIAFRKFLRTNTESKPRGGAQRLSGVPSQMLCRAQGKRQPANCKSTSQIAKLRRLNMGLLS
jgi:hypothetical protein